MQVKILPMLPPLRTEGCGTCTMCCKLLGVNELKKAQNDWCTHVKQGRGCGIYPDRPTSCRDFECVWLGSQFGTVELRPDHIKGMLVPTTNGQNLVLHEDPGYPGKAHAALRPILDQWIADGTRYYVIVRGKTRTFYGNPALLPAATSMVNEKADGGDDDGTR